MLSSYSYDSTKAEFCTPGLFNMGTLDFTFKLQLRYLHTILESLLPPRYCGHCANSLYVHQSFRRNLGPVVIYSVDQTTLHIKCDPPHQPSHNGQAALADKLSTHTDKKLYLPSLSACVERACVRARTQMRCVHGRRAGPTALISLVLMITHTMQTYQSDSITDARMPATCVKCISTRTTPKNLPFE